MAALAVACSAPVTASGTSGARPDPEAAPAPAVHAVGIAGGDDRSARRLETPKELFGGDVRGRCPEGMADIEGRFCIDRYEASVVEILPSGDERPYSPFEAVGKRAVRAVSRPDVFPQGYISAVEAQRACAASGKRLCRVPEWTRACRGPERTAFGYGERREPGRCNDRGRNPVIALFGRGRWTWQTMNQPILNQIEGTLTRTGAHEGCTNGYGVYDMVGNLHEWVADPRGSFRGGYYQDTTQHGAGCAYVTSAHAARYHDYSTGFRCCADLPGSEPPPKRAPKRRAPRRRR